jgi:hypothetical protein
MPVIADEDGIRRSLPVESAPDLMFLAVGIYCPHGHTETTASSITKQATPASRDRGIAASFMKSTERFFRRNAAMKVAPSLRP